MDVSNQPIQPTGSLTLFAVKKDYDDYEEDDAVQVIGCHKAAVSDSLTR